MKAYNPLWESNASIAAINDQVRLGTWLMHGYADKPFGGKPRSGYVVDLFQVIKIEDARDHWRGEENLRLTVVGIHSSDFGFNLAVKDGKTQDCVESVDTYDIADPWSSWTIVEPQDVFECRVCGRIELLARKKPEDGDPICDWCEERLALELRTRVLAVQSR